jgi:hypothetical protein
MNRKECLERYAIDKNLSGANLNDANLSGADLSVANLSGADLCRANLSGANLYGTNLHGAYLHGAYLNDANLSGADLSGADLSGANLSGVVLPKTFKIARIDFGDWSVCVTREETTIGCQRYTNAEWLKFTVKDVEDFAEGASEWWKLYGPVVKAAIKAVQS